MNTPSILKEIVAKRKIRLEKEKSKVSPCQMIELAKKAGDRLSFLETLKKDGLSIIGEIKKASPSKGLIKGDFYPSSIAKEYEGNVDSLSVLTEEDYFMGSPKYLYEVAQAVNTPILRKDFIFDEYQIYEAKYLGASAVLLITAILDSDHMKLLLGTAHSLNMDALVETHSLEEAEIAIDSGAKIIGINNRDLNTFEVDLNTTLDIAAIIPSGIIKVSESGFHSASDIHFVKQAGIDAVLVGESFMRCDDIAKKAKELKDAYKD